MDGVTHFELPARDMGRAKGFYEGVFDWKVTSFPMPNGEYSMATTTESSEYGAPVNPGMINGGIMPYDENTQHPVVIMSVASIEESLKKVEAAGGTVVMTPQDMSGMGLYARIKDTEGNVVGVWQDTPQQG